MGASRASTLTLEGEGDMLDNYTSHQIHKAIQSAQDTLRYAQEILKYLHPAGECAEECARQVITCARETLHLLHAARERDEKLTPPRPDESGGADPATRPPKPVNGQLSPAEKAAQAHADVGIKTVRIELKPGGRHADVTLDELEPVRLTISRVLLLQALCAPTVAAEHDAKFVGFKSWQRLAEHVHRLAKDQRAAGNCADQVQTYAKKPPERQTIINAVHTLRLAIANERLVETDENNGASYRFRLRIDGDLDVVPL